MTFCSHQSKQYLSKIVAISRLIAYDVILLYGQRFSLRIGVTLVQSNDTIDTARLIHQFAERERQRGFSLPNKQSCPETDQNVQFLLGIKDMSYGNALRYSCVYIENYIRVGKTHCSFLYVYYFERFFIALVALTSHAFF